MGTAFVLFSACSQEQLQLGALPRDAGADGEIDLAAEADASDGSSSGASPISLRLRALGRDNVVKLNSLCGTECVPVELLIEGGVPPYSVRWDDGVTRADRTLCANLVFPRSVTVFDSSEGANPPASLGLNAIESSGCSSDPLWEVCYLVPPKVQACPNADAGVAIDLGRQLLPEDSISGFMVLREFEAGGRYQLFGAAALCAAESQVGGYQQVNLIQDEEKESTGTTRLEIHYAGAPYRYLSVKNVVSPAPTIIFPEPDWFTPVLAPFEVSAIQLCENLPL
jgi:hypothetical protein